MSSIEGIEDPFGPGTAGGTALLEREETQLSEPGDHERFSHYVRKEKILESALNPCAPSAAKCGYPAATRRSSPSAPSARKSTKASHRATTATTAPANNTRQTIRLRQIRIRQHTSDNMPE